MTQMDDLVTRLKLDISDYEKNAKKAEKSTDSLEKETKELSQTNKKAGDSFDKLMNAFTGLNQGIQLAQQAFAILKKGYDAVILSTVEYAEEVRQLSRTIGSTPEDASKLIQAADDVKVSFDTLQTSMNIAIRNGLEPTIEGMGRLADEYVGITDPIARAKFLLDNFGRSGADMAPLLEIGSKGITELGAAAEATGLVLDKKALKATRDFEIAVDNLDDKLRGMATQIGIKVVPSITNLLDTFNNASIDTDGLSNFIIKQVDDASMVVLQFTQIALALQAVSEGAISVTDLWGYLYNSFFSTNQEVETLTADIQNLNAFLGNTPPVLDDVSAATKEAEAAAIELGKQLKIEEENYKTAGDVLRNDLATAYDAVAKAEKGWRTGVAGSIKSDVEKQFEDGKLSIDQYTSALSTLDATYGTGFAIEFEMEQKIPELVEKLLTDPASFVNAAKAFEDYFMPLDESVKGAKKVVEELQLQLDNLQKEYLVKVKIITSGTVTQVGSFSGGGGGGGTNHNTDAGGGTVAAGSHIKWSEYGPEPFIPAQDGRILSHADAMNAVGRNDNSDNSALLNAILFELQALPQGMKIALQEAIVLMGG